MSMRGTENAISLRVSLFSGCVLACLPLACADRETSPPRPMNQATAAVPPPWQPVELIAVGEGPPVPADASLRPAHERAIVASNTLFGQLSAALLAAIGTPASVAAGEAPGPAGAIAVCQEAAPQIAATVSEEAGLRIGRTGVRLRNGQNTAPAWAIDAIAARSGEPRAWRSPSGDGDARLGVLLPIRMMPLCMQCHGPRDLIDPAVIAALEERYPGDQATGFEANELRGWFWIEAPLAR